MANKFVDPLWGYWVMTSEYLTDYDRQILMDLYQPLMGSEAASLYQLLWNQQQILVSERQMHAQLLNLLDLDAKAFYQARLKLEALALLQTYAAKDTLGQYLIYQLHEPLLPQKFFNDGILKTFLYEKIGEQDFIRLQKKYRTPSLPQSSNIKEITHSFLDVFHLSSADILKMETTRDVQTDTPVIPKYTQSQLATFDWQLLQDYIASYHVRQSDILQHQNELFNVHAFYGVTEIEMADLIANTLNVTNNQIDIKRLQNVAQKRFEDRVNIQVRNEHNNQVLQPTEPKLSGVTSAEQKLLQHANQLAPAEFLAWKKQQKKGFVGSSETRVLRQLQQRAILPLPVINILIDYVLNNSATLTQGLVETIANDWLQNNVSTASAAIQRIKEHAQPSKVKTTKNKSAYRSYQPHREQVTDWTKHQAKKIDPKAFAAAQKKLREFEKGLNGD
ncbi:DnaD domain protein [Bombilactobacillus bombi]|uniref:DnaD domain protein n=1 Tax=Bombilactobacillus bombi TaxID=1303590 RepID=UPI0015E5CD58|nr:DnaD domain protein [Bombilactobacillus bombi]